MNETIKFKNQVREYLVQQYLEALHQERIPWQQGWNKVGPNRNGVTEKPYRGINALVLQLNQIMFNYTDPRWCTFKQIKDQGWHLQKGSKGTTLEFWSMYDKVNKQNITIQDYNAYIENGRPKEEFRIINRLFTVFNAQCIDGIPDLELETKNEIQQNQIIQKIIENMNVKYEEKGDSAYYRPREDKIVLPPSSRFHSTYEYNATKLHEMCHASGHPTRLNRNLNNAFGSIEYAKEELRAEIGSSFLMQELGLSLGPEHIENHKAYIQSWITILENDPNELFAAVKDADKIADYMREKGELYQEKNIENQLTPQLSKRKSLKERKQEARRIGEEHRTLQKKIKTKNQDITL